MKFRPCSLIHNHKSYFLGQQMVKVIITLVGKLGTEIALIEDHFEMISVMNDGQLRNVYQNNNLKFTQFTALRNKIIFGTYHMMYGVGCP